MLVVVVVFDCVVQLLGLVGWLSDPTCPLERFFVEGRLEGREEKIQVSFSSAMENNGPHTTNN